MKLLQKILTKLNGLHYSQEYLCFADETLPHKPHLYLVQDHQVIGDITTSHLFVGYCPLIFAFSLTGLPRSVRLMLSNRALQPNENFTTKDALASLQLHLIKQQSADNSQVLYYEAVQGSHHFISAFHQHINKKYNQWYNQKPGNVFLHDNLYKQVQIAYALPRQISLITVGSNELYNLFPTDLHGAITHNHYIISLRTGGLACKQVLSEKKLLISQMQSRAYKMVYSLGKNHMQPLKAVPEFPFSPSVSEKFNLPVPQQAISCKELVLQDSFTQGIHTILFFKIASSNRLESAEASLAHINNCYATWRYKNGLGGNYLMR